MRHLSRPPIPILHNEHQCGHQYGTHYEGIKKDRSHKKHSKLLKKKFVRKAESRESERHNEASASNNFTSFHDTPENTCTIREALQTEFYNAADQKDIVT